MTYAFQTHAQQLRKGTAVPYVAHLLGVTALVLEDGGGEDEAIAALLHEAVEDQGGRARLSDIEERFGGTRSPALWMPAATPTSRRSVDLAALVEEEQVHG